MYGNRLNPAETNEEYFGASNNAFDTAHAAADAAAAMGIEPFPPPDHTMVDNQTGMPSPRPDGCSEAARSGWDFDGWWYRGNHDSCPIPTIHRHGSQGQVTFAGFHDILELVNGIVQRARAGYDGERGQ